MCGRLYGQQVFLDEFSLTSLLSRVTVNKFSLTGLPSRVQGMLFKHLRHVTSRQNHIEIFILDKETSDCEFVILNRLF